MSCAFYLFQYVLVLDQSFLEGKEVPWSPPCYDFFTLLGQWRATNVAPYTNRNSNLAKVSPPAFCGLFTTWVHEMNVKDFGNIPFAMPGYAYITRIKAGFQKGWRYGKC